MTESMAGRRFGRYELLTTLETGGMAELLLGYVPGPGGFRKYVAIKRILPQLRREEDFVAMFLDEARITAALSHANIGQVFDLGSEPDELYIAMEFIAGQDLRRIFSAPRKAGRLLPVGFTCAVIRDVCLALHHAHSFTSPGGEPLPVIHRDVKPRNVMVTYSGWTKVIDFGIAKARGALSTTQAGSVKGSPQYMAPEQIRGEPISGRTDLFAVAAVLYEGLTGVSPFAAPDEAATMYRILTGEVKPPQALNPAVSAELGAVVMKALQRDPEDRFRTGRELARALERACPELYTEEQLSGLMGEYFADAKAKTERVLALASDQDSGKLREAAGALVADFTPHPVLPTSKTQVELPVLGPERAIVLAVDDTQIGRAVVERFLRQVGHEVLTASSGKEALEVISQIRPDLFILDVRMPEMDGFELCRRIRGMEDFRHTPIVFLSAACSVDERAEGLHAGGDDFIRKPFDEPDLVARVKIHLQKFRARREAAAAAK